MDKLGFNNHPGIRAMFEEGLPKIYDVWKGKYKKFEDLPTTPEEFIPAYKIFWLGSELVHTEVPDFGKNFYYTELGFEDWFQSSNLALQQGFKEKYSAEAYKLIRAYDVGVICFIEFAFQILDIRIEKKIRNTVLFRLILDLHSIGIGLTNDLLGLKRDIKYSGSNDYVIRVANESNLEDAVAKTLKNIVEHALDLRAALDFRLLTQRTDMFKILSMRWLIVGMVR
jgi:hypothetical protein